MQQLYCIAQQFYLVVFPTLLDCSHTTHTPAREFIAPMCRRDVSTADR
jgi:hypothetical protein